MEWILSALIAGLVGLGVGYIARQNVAQRQLGTAEQKTKELLEQAKKKAEDAILSAKNRAVTILEEATHEEKERKVQITRLEDRLAQREARLDDQFSKLALREDDLLVKVERVQALKAELEELKERQNKKLEEVAGMTKEAAREHLLAQTESAYAEDLIRRIKKLEQDGFAELERKAQEILSTAIQRYSGSHAAEITTTVVPLQSDDLKGRIIGKEGRNIKALERATGVEILVDDTPGAVILSSFDPLRRQVAKAALEKLLEDGRIQPARIEEMVAWAQAEIDEKIRASGEAAVYEVGVVGLDPRLVHLLGRLRFRTSFGQNVLLHSIEAAHLAGMIASELGADVAVAKKGALLHDIGKAVDHEVEGTHVEIGRKLLTKFNVEEPVVKAMQSHHEEYPFETVESIIVKVAESISAARPGARRDTVENYLKRLEELEKIANGFEGVKHSYAIQAGRELRVFVIPESVDDYQSVKLAKNIAEKIEENLQYPGEIKVTVIRENRAVEYAR